MGFRNPVTSLSGSQITPGTLGPGVLLPASQVSAGTLALEVLAQQLANGTVTPQALALGAVTAAALAANAVTSAALAAGAVTAAALAAGAVVAGKIAAGAVTAGTIAAGVVTATTIAADTITATQIAAGAIGVAELAADAITGKTITGGTITGATLQTAAAGKHVLINTTGALHGASGYQPAAQFFSGDPSEWSQGWIAAGVELGGASDPSPNGDRPYLELRTPDISADGHGTAVLTLYGQRRDGTRPASCTSAGVAYSAGWGDYGSGYTPVTWYKDADGFIRLCGLLTRTGATITSAASGTIFTLPPGACPAGNETFIMNKGGAAVVFCQVSSGGIVQVAAPNTWATGEFMYLGGAMFKAA